MEERTKACKKVTYLLTIRYGGRIITGMLTSVGIFAFKEIPRHEHKKEWEMHYIVDGRGWFRNGTRFERFTQGAIFFSPPGTDHEAHSDNHSAFPYYHILFNPDSRTLTKLLALANWAKEEEGKPFGPLNAANHASTALNELRLRFSSADVWANEAADHLFSVFLCDLLDGQYAPKSRNERPFLEAVLERMHASLTGTLDLDELAREQGIDKAYLIRRFKQATGIPPHRYFLDLKLKNAAFQLRHGNFPIKAIAADLGFYDEFHFSKQFKLCFQVSPTDYRLGVRP